MSEPSQHSVLFIPYTFRPYWQPNSGAFPVALHQQLENLTQELVSAEKKEQGYLRLIGSLYVELKRYQDTKCHCKVNVTQATIPSTPTGFTPLSNAFTSPIEQTVVPIVQPEVAAELSWHITSSYSTHVPATTSHSSESSSITDLETPVSETTTSSSHPPDYTNWSVEYNPEIKQTLRLHLKDTFIFTTKVLCAKFSRDGKYLAVGLGNGETHLHDMMTGFRRVSVLAARSTVFYTEAANKPSMIWAVGFSLDNKLLATTGSRHEINIWQIDRKRVRATFEHTDLVRSLDFSPDGHFLVSASYDKSVCMWSLRDGSKRAVWHGPSDFTSVAFSPDGRYVAAGNYRGFLWIWDARTGQLMDNHKIGDSSIVSMRVTFTPDGKGIASGGDTLSCWDLASLNDNRSLAGRHTIEDNPTAGQLKQIFDFTGHKGYITSLSFSSDNRWIVSSSLDHSMRILDAQTGTWLCILKAHTEHIRAADFSPVGHYIVSGGQDCLVRLWMYEVVE